MSDIVESAQAAVQAFDYLIKCVTSGPYNHWRHLGMDEDQVIPRPDGKSNNSDGVADSWRDKEVFVARLTRQKVNVALPDGRVIEYKSLREAFAENGLPLAPHIRFRLRLKEAGELPYEHGGKTWLFKMGDVRTDWPPK